MLKKVTVFLFILSGVVSSYSQKKTYDYLNYVQQKDSLTLGTVKITQNELISQQYYSHLYKIRQNTTIQGYSVQLYSDGTAKGYENFLKQKAKLLSVRPDIEPVYKYDAPFHKLYVGKFRTKSEALKLQRQIGYLFDGEFIIEQPFLISEFKVE